MGTTLYTHLLIIQIYRLLKIAISCHQTGRSPLMRGRLYGAFNNNIDTYYKQIVPTGLPCKGILFVEKMVFKIMQTPKGWPVKIP